MTEKKLPLMTSIGDLGLSVRATSRLQDWLGPEATLGDLVECTATELRDAPHVGPKTFREIVLAVNAAGHQLTRPPFKCCNWCRHWHWFGNGLNPCTRMERLATGPTYVCPDFDPPKLSVSEVRQRVEEIRTSSCDYEHAHGREDDLYHDFIRSLATRHDEIGRLARTVLQTRLLVFERYRA